MQLEVNTMNRFSDANWFSLEQSAKDGNVIPIVGPDALIVEYEGQTVPFYRLVTKDLLTNFQIEPDSEILQHTWSLHRAGLPFLPTKATKVPSSESAGKSFVLSINTAKRLNPPKVCGYWLAFRHSRSTSAWHLTIYWNVRWWLLTLFWLSVPSPFGRVMPPNHSLTCRYPDRANAAYSRCWVPAPALAVVLPCTKKKL